MSVKFLIVGDIHYKATNPRARLDNYQEALHTKMEEVYELAEKHQVEALIIPGDLTDSPSMAIPTIFSLAVLLQRSPCKVICIPGNHDGFGHNLGSISRTPYGLLSGLNFFKDIQAPTETHDIFTYTDKTNKQNYIDGMITGQGFNNETDIDLMQYAINPETEEAFRKICHATADRYYKPFYVHVTHGMLLTEDPGIDMRYTPVSKLAEIPEELQPHVLINGHYHFGFEPQRVGRTLVINPGALMRMSAHHEEMERRVQVALLTINSVEDYGVEYIPLKTALPGDQVLSREHIEAEAERNQRLEKFLGLLAEEGESKFLEIRDIVEDIAARDAMPAAVKSEALSRLAAAREGLKG